MNIKDEPNIGYWRKLKVGDMIYLNDEQAIQDSLENGEVDGVEYEITNVRKISEQNNMVEWIIFDLIGSVDDDELFIVIKKVGADIDIKVFFAVDQFEPGNREDVVDNDEVWFFNDFDEDPEDEDFDYNDLEYRKEIENEVDDEERIFKMKPQGVLYGSCKDENDSEEYFTTVVEYDTDAECENPELLILETGESDVGGYITIMMGCLINYSEIDVFPQD